MSRLDRGGKRKSRKLNIKEERPSTCLIIAEGEETEVNYFENIKKIINTRFRNREIQENYPIKVEGLGRSTTVLVKEAIKKKNRENFSTVWVVFDKDSNSDFDSAIKLAEDNDINVAWSNESFELWLLLHFQDLKSPISRYDYTDRLSQHFKTNNINKGKYEKNFLNIFEVTQCNIDTAIRRSESLRNYFENQGEFKYSKMNPATSVDMLIKSLLNYLR